jgi:nucleosome binding factor SPN SPT16 subunit
MDLL